MCIQTGFPYFRKSAAAVGERKVKMALRFKWIFANSAEIIVQNEPLANCFPPICDFCKTYKGVKYFPHLGRFCEFQKKWKTGSQSLECRYIFGGFRENPFKT